MSHFLKNPPLQELQGPSLSMIIFFIKNTMQMVVDEPRKIIPQFMWMKVWKVNYSLCIYVLYVG